MLGETRLGLKSKPVNESKLFIIVVRHMRLTGQTSHKAQDRRQSSALLAYLKNGHSMTQMRRGPCFQTRVNALSVFCTLPPPFAKHAPLEILVEA